jgi:hypothetical protein
MSRRINELGTYKELFLTLHIETVISNKKIDFHIAEAVNRFVWPCHTSAQGVSMMLYNALLLARAYRYSACA